MDKGGAAGQRGSGAGAETWNLWIDEQPRPGWANMAIDQALLDRAEYGGESWLRLYRWHPYCLSFGRHEPAFRRYDVDRIAALGLDTVRRPTGGRAVWHSRELTYSVAAPSVRFGALQAAYLEIHEMLRGALRGIGIGASLAANAPTPGLDAGACFARAAGGEVMVGERKVVGSAQLRRGSALLQHGSILLEDEQQVVLDLTRGWVESGPGYLPHKTQHSIGHVREAVATEAASRWRGTWRRVTETGPVLRMAAAHIPQFQSPAWTWAR
jgi:lipoyl(octanoyl) transferase